MSSCNLSKQVVVLGSSDQVGKASPRSKSSGLRGDPGGDRNFGCAPQQSIQRRQAKCPHLDPFSSFTFRATASEFVVVAERYLWDCPSNTNTDTNPDNPDTNLNAGAATVECTFTG